MKTKQRGSAWSIRLVYRLYRLFGYTFIYYLMYPVSYFYFLKAQNVKEALKLYYARLGKVMTGKMHHDHLRHFAICLCDRFISLVAPLDYTYEIEKQEELEEALHQGGVLLLSHYGGWASAANCFGHLNLKMNIVMQEVLMQGIKDIEESIKGTSVSHIHIIDTAKGGIAVTLDIAHALQKRELVAMMADRATSDKNTKAIPFLGADGYFNKNPFEIAYKTNQPLIALFVRYVRPQCYVLEYTMMTMNQEKRMSDEVLRCMHLYAKAFEASVHAYPQGWFNFYNFWEK